METAWEFAYLSDRVSAGEGCEAAVPARTICGWAMSREWRELLYGRRFPLKLKGADNRSYVRPSILHGSEALCQKESEMEILRRRRDSW